MQRSLAGGMARLWVRAAGASPALRRRSFFNLGFLSGGGGRVPLTFEGHPLGTDGRVTVQAKVRPRLHYRLLTLCPPALARKLVILDAQNTRGAHTAPSPPFFACA